MRTTVDIDDRLLREAKQTAASRGITLSDLVNQALRQVFARTVAPAPRFEMITYGEGVPAVHRDPAELSRALEDEERDSLRR